MYACDYTKELIIKAHNNDKSAREKLVIDNSGLVWSIVKRFTGRGAEHGGFVPDRLYRAYKGNRQF